MTLPIERHRDVLRDIAECADYIANGSVLAADRFVTDVQKTIELIQRMPGIGGLKAFADARLADVRICRLKRFKKHLVVYVV